MPQIGSFVQSVYREESRTTGELIAAVCAAQTEFLPIALDSEGTRNGVPYRYASIKAIRRAIQPALSKHGLLCHHVYGTVAGEGEYVCTLLRHTSGEYLSSTLRVPFREDIQESKAAKTLLCRTAIEGLLGIVTEDDDDGQSDSAANAALNEAWAKNLAMAKTAILAATDAASLDRYESLAKKRIADGALSPDCGAEIDRLIAERKSSLKKGTSNAGSTRPVGTQGPNAAGSGSGGSHGESQRSAAVAG